MKVGKIPNILQKIYFFQILTKLTRSSRDNKKQKWCCKEAINMDKMTYHSFLIRLWLVKQTGKLSWRASLENPLTAQKQYFDCFEDLFTHLQQLKNDLEKKL